MIDKPMNDEYDIVIVGAGPAGCSAAKFLSNKYNVLMIDRTEPSNYKVCGGLLVEETQEFIKGWEIPDNVFSHPNYLDLKLIDWNNEAKIDIKKKMWNISRREFDSWLLTKIKDHVQFFSQTKFLKFEKRRNYIEIVLEVEKKRKVIRTKYLIGANGSFSNIRQCFATRPLRHYIAVQYWLKYRGINDSSYFIYDNEITNFYSWIIQKKEGLILGSALETGSLIDKKMEILKNKVKNEFNIDGDVFRKEHAVLSRPTDVEDIILGNNRIFLIGEAAGLISSSTGEGISFALRSGYNCAQALNENFKNAFPAYKIFSEELINEVKLKIDRADRLSDTKKRSQMFV